MHPNPSRALPKDSWHLPEIWGLKENQEKLRSRALEGLGPSQGGIWGGMEWLQAGSGVQGDGN